MAKGLGKLQRRSDELYIMRFVHALLLFNSGRALQVVSVMSSQRVACRISSSMKGKYI